MAELIRPKQITSLIKSLGKIKGAVREYRKFGVNTFTDWKNRIWIKGKLTNGGNIPVNKYNKFIYISGRLYQSFGLRVDKRVGFQISGGVRPKQLDKINAKIGQVFDLSKDEILKLESMIYDTIFNAYYK
jgi:hypothetical protein